MGQVEGERKAKMMLEEKRKRKEERETAET